MNVRADQVMPGQTLVLRSERGKATPVMVSKVVPYPEGCRHHVHITVKGHSSPWCYEPATLLEVA